MTSETIKYNIEGAVATITLDRPKVLNAMNSQCLQECMAALKAAEADKAVRAVIIEGNEKAFTAGADISEIAEFGPQEMKAYNRQWLDWFDAIEKSRLPVIASCAGWSTGGGTEMSLACDFVICADTAKFGLFEINIGVIPGAGAAVRLTRWMGRLRAKEILMLGEAVTADEAVALHLANFSVPADDLKEETRVLAEKLANKAPLAIAAAKKCVNEAAEAALPVAMEHELGEFLLLFASDDQKEGMAAFLEKRAPQFKGQ